ncbi:MAG: hypothetical protein ABF760_00425 [Zymomonas mobilis]|uniref:Preprotein translocase subunit SecD n=1 Tax=Zymomonas mobilis TaxID=542 RepID=A0A542W1K9_ZYMMB|nr:hypothetical protein [Zymomonas mobilis]TQL17457.1 hypothetical protein FBY58_1043 [Zymomonas mobilis]
MILSALLLASAPVTVTKVEPIPLDKETDRRNGKGQGKDKNGFFIGDQLIAPADIIDARALPQLKGNPIIMLTLTGDGTERLTEATAGNGFSQMIEIRFKGAVLSQLVLGSPIRDNVLTFSVPVTYQKAQSIAAEISQKQPLPESTE